MEMEAQKMRKENYSKIENPAPFEKTAEMKKKLLESMMTAIEHFHLSYIYSRITICDHLRNLRLALPKS